MLANDRDLRISWPYAETLTCRYCGKAYKSRGKHDPGYCRDCGMVFTGGPLDGQIVGEILYENSRSETETD